METSAPKSVYIAAATDACKGLTIGRYLCLAINCSMNVSGIETG